jgi:hypothetical protein
VTFTGSGVTGTTLPAPTGSSWTRNGSATTAAGDLVLTPAQTNQAGSAFYSSTLPSDGLNARFTVKINAGTGADGLHYVATSTNVDALTAGTHDVDVTAYGGHLRVTVDGDVKIDTAVALPATVRPGFTAATGGLTNQHVVRNVAITSPQAAADTAPPSLELTSPTADSVVTGATAVTASATDDDSGVSTVSFALDGNPLGTAVTAAPYQLAWDTTTVPNGMHTLSATATDAGGNRATTKPIMVTVNNPPPHRHQHLRRRTGNAHRAARFDHQRQRDPPRPGQRGRARFGRSGDDPQRRGPGVEPGEAGQRRPGHLGGLAGQGHRASQRGRHQGQAREGQLRLADRRRALPHRGRRSGDRRLRRDRLPLGNITTTTAGSWVIGVGNDPTSATGRSPSPGRPWSTNGSTRSPD